MRKKDRFIAVDEDHRFDQDAAGVRGNCGVDEIAGSLDPQLVGGAQIRRAQGTVPRNGGA
jgi:hypothetical protein